MRMMGMRWYSVLIVPYPGTWHDAVELAKK
jgi:hypothetical protein